jgi:hypothetical protein
MVRRLIAVVELLFQIYQKLIPALLNFPTDVKIYIGMYFVVVIDTSYGNTSFTTPPTSLNLIRIKRRGSKILVRCEKEPMAFEITHSCQRL